MTFNFSLPGSCCVSNSTLLVMDWLDQHRLCRMYGVYVIYERSTYSYAKNKNGKCILESCQTKHIQKS